MANRRNEDGRRGVPSISLPVLYGAYLPIIAAVTYCYHWGTLQPPAAYEQTSVATAVAVVVVVVVGRRETKR